MKKLYLFIFLFFSFVLNVSADGTSTYYIEANIQSNGDMQVKELKILDGNYNGVKTNLRFQNPYLKQFTGTSLDDFEGSSIYNGTALTDLKVYDVKIDNNDFGLVNKPNKEFKLVNSADVGDYGKYTKEVRSDGVNLTIYMPSKYNHASLVTYTIKDAIVVHNDIAELAWDFISSSYEEDISNLKVIVNLPSDSNELRVFSHGPLNGENRIINKRSVEMTYDYLYRGNAVDMRVVFDKSLVSEANKKSNIDGLDKILKVEEIRANQANQIREQEYKRLEQDAISFVEIAKTTLKKDDYEIALTFVNKLNDGEVKTNLLNELDIVQEKIDKRINLWTSILYLLSIIWLIGLIILVRKIYIKYDKELKSNFEVQYFRDIPSDYNPGIVSYLINKNIVEDSFGASVLELIRKKVLLLEEIEVKNKKDYKLTLNQNYDINTLSIADNKLIDLLINKIGDNNSVTLKEVQKYSKNYSSAKTFMTLYDSWKNLTYTDALNEGFYQTSNLPKWLSVLYSLILIPLLLLGIDNEINCILLFILLIPMVASIIYFISYTKKTQKGIDEYRKWIGLKNFLNDFGRFSEKELPEIHLWERYLVYATLFGIADKVQKVMKVKLQNINYNDTDFTFLYLRDLYFYRNLNNTLNSSISSARSTITQHEIATSSRSSSGGFGGGSSFGGGGFGGGGSSGGRF
ncbi:MAG: DUF2207 domain-containing protein [Bacilli bacterium]|nr:DUF2207 domain-containing protein [Bacilli bacterium]